MTKPIVTVLGGTGSQGGGVVNALLAAGNFSVRVASRNPTSDAARALTARGVEVVKADLLEPSGLLQDEIAELKDVVIARCCTGGGAYLWDLLGRPS